MSSTFARAVSERNWAVIDTPPPPGTLFILNNALSLTRTTIISAIDTGFLAEYDIGFPYPMSNPLVGHPSQVTVQQGATCLRKEGYRAIAEGLLDAHLQSIEIAIAATASRRPTRVPFVGNSSFTIQKMMALVTLAQAIMTIGTAHRRSPDMM